MFPLTAGIGSIIFLFASIFLRSHFENDAFLFTIIILTILLMICKFLANTRSTIRSQMVLSVREDGVLREHPLLPMIERHVRFSTMDRSEVIRGEYRQELFHSYLSWEGSPVKMVVHPRSGRRLKIGPRSPDTIIRAVNAIASTGSPS